MKMKNKLWIVLLAAGVALAGCKTSRFNKSDVEDDVYFSKKEEALKKAEEDKKKGD